MKSVFRMMRDELNTNRAKCVCGSVKAAFAVLEGNRFASSTGNLNTRKVEHPAGATTGLLMKKAIQSTLSPAESTTAKKDPSIFSRLSLAVSILLLSSSGISFAQAGFAVSGQAITPGGTPAAGARITVCPYTASGIPCSPQSSIYSNINLTGSPLPQPYASDQHGNYTFYVAPYSSYLVQIAVNQTTTYSYVFTAATNSIGCTTTTDGYFQVSNAPGCVDTYADYGETTANTFTFNDSFAINASAQNVGETYDPGSFTVNVNDGSGLGGGFVWVTASSASTTQEQNCGYGGSVCIGSTSDSGFDGYQAAVSLKADPLDSNNAHATSNILLQTCNAIVGGTMGSNGCDIDIDADADNFQTTTGGANITMRAQGTITLMSNAQGILMNSPIQGPSTAPTGSCTLIGWVFSQDGHATFCNGTTWVTKI